MASDNPFWVHPTALCDSESIGDGTRVWAFSHVMDDVVIGADCNIGEHVFLESGAVIGDRVTVENGVQLWEGTAVEDDVFIGPNAVFSNDRYPRSARFEVVHARYETKGWLSGITLRKGASIGAGAVIIPGVEVGEYAMIAAGAVVTRNVKPHSLVAGCPATERCKVCLCGHPVGEGPEYACGECGRKYELSGDVFSQID